jgi:hypothetical protein
MLRRRPSIRQHTSAFVSFTAAAYASFTTCSEAVILLAHCFVARLSGFTASFTTSLYYELYYLQ